MEELGERMSAQEFAEWQVFFAKEQLHPAAHRVRHAQLVASMYQGPSTRKGGKAWTAADFLNPDPWAAPVVPQPTQGTAASRMRSMTRRGRKK